jgi:hypothetical protein
VLRFRPVEGVAIFATAAGAVGAKASEAEGVGAPIWAAAAAIGGLPIAVAVGRLPVAVVVTADTSEAPPVPAAFTVEVVGVGRFAVAAIVAAFNGDATSTFPDKSIQRSCLEPWHGT